MIFKKNMFGSGLGSYKQNVEESLMDKLSDAEFEMFNNKLEMKNAPGYRERIEKGLR